MTTEGKNTFQVVDEGFTLREAVAEAKKCLQCRVPLCRKGCPIENDIPQFIHALTMGNLGDAMRIINEKSNLPAICGRVCPHEKQCQGHCVLNKKNEPIQIGKIEQFIADFDTEMNLTREPLPQKSRGKIAVIGSGPAGLTVAGDLARIGFNVTIYEEQNEPGGVLMYGIPEYRLPKKVVRAEIEKIAALGVNFKCNTLIGEGDNNIDSLFEQGFDAIFIGTGTAVPQNMDTTPGATLRGVSQSTYFLHNVNSFNEGAISRNAVPLRPGERVAVIGGGNVAMDTARTAIRLGAEVTVLYRRTEAEMPAIKAEYEQAVAEGVKFEWQTTVTEFIAGSNGRLAACKLKTPTDRPMGMTTRRGVFAGGDVVHRPQTVVLAMKAAKDVAQGIAQYVDAIKLLEVAKKVEEERDAAK